MSRSEARKRRINIRSSIRCAVSSRTMNNNRVNIAGIEIDNLSMREAIVHVERLMSEKQSHYVVTPNVDHIVKLQRDEEFRRIYREASLVLADGTMNDERLVN